MSIHRVPSPARASEPLKNRDETTFPPFFLEIENMMYEWMEGYVGDDDVLQRELAAFGIREDVLAELVDVMRVYVCTRGNVHEACRGTDHIFDYDDLLLTLDAWKPVTPLFKTFRSWCWDQIAPV